MAKSTKKGHAEDRDQIFKLMERGKAVWKRKRPDGE